VPEPLVIQSHKGPYTVVFDDGLLANPRRLLDGEPHFLVDSNVARLYAGPLKPVLEHPRTIRIEATEENKSIERIVPVIEELVRRKVRRNHTLVAIGGGIVQDVTCFVASTLLRGVPWKFVPTTLLAQADSCIGSKSSINVGDAKNILGTFNPPREIYVCSRFLETLEDRDVRSGIGEILKVHAIEGASAYDRLAADYDKLRVDRGVLLQYIRQALLIKQRYIEIDEFDRDVRNVFNYGHSFGHAIESATDFGVPHGIAVTMGMDIANRVATLRGLTPERNYARVHPALAKNYREFGRTPVELDALLGALTKDKKNTSSNFVLILPVGENAEIQRVEVAPDAAFRDQCAAALLGLAV
jgi:3-dehydroquinate synthase